MHAGRRRFLCSALGAGAGMGLGSLPFVWSRLASPAETTRRSWALGSEVSMTVLGLPEGQANLALDAAFGELETVEEVMSLYRPHSQVCRLNASGTLANPHPYLLEVLALARQTSESTGGAFDITVQPLWSLYQSAKREGRLPTAVEIAQARTKVDWRSVQFSAREVRFTRPGTQITLNGIAQGFAADLAMAALRAHGVEHALVNTGEVGGLGGKSAAEDWSVGIQHPRERDAYVSLAGLNGRSLATSGDYESTFTPDFLHHHIFDPSTGSSPGEVASVSVVAPTAMQADALSTALMVLGVERSKAWIESLSDVEAQFTLKDGRCLQTAGFPELASA